MSELMLKGNYEGSLESFAENWIYELECSMSNTITAYRECFESWEKSVKFAIELRAWREQYRKVSQLCNAIGGETLDLFEQIFPHGVDEYKSREYPIY